MLVINGNEDVKYTQTISAKNILFDKTAPILLDINKDELKNQANNKLIVKAKDEHTSIDSVQISW